MFGLGTTELIILLVIVLIFFGAGKLPEVGGGIAKGIRSFKKNLSDEKGKDESAIEAAASQEVKTEQKEKTTAHG